MSKSNAKILNLLVRLSNGRDWMGAKINKNSGKIGKRATLHHIKAKRDGGKYVIENVALLRRDSHDLLNELEKNNPELYEEWQIFFKGIANSGSVITEEDMDRMNELRQESLRVRKR